MKVFRWIAVVAALALALAGCGNSASSSSSSKNLRIVATFLDSIPAMGALKVADQRGYFKDSGLDLKFASASGGGDTLRPLSTGDADIAIGSPAASVLAAQSNPKLKIAAIWLPYNPFYFAGVKSRSNLDGARLGGSVGASTVNLLIDGLSKKIPADLKTQKAGTGSMGDDWAAVKAGHLDASWVMQPFLTQVQDADNAKMVIDAAKYIPDYPADMVVVNEDYAKSHKAELENFFKAVNRIFAEFSTPSKQAVLATDLGKVMTYQESVLNKYLTTESKSRLEQTYNLKMNQGVLDNVSTFMQNANLIKSPVKWSDIVDQSYLPADDQLPSL